MFLGGHLHLVLIAAWGMGGAVRESRSALKSGAAHGPAECSWSVQRCKRSEGEMKVIVGAAASIPFFHFGSTLMGLVCCLYCLILSVVITAAYIITSSCYPRASSCTSYLRSVLLPCCCPVVNAHATGMLSLCVPILRRHHCCVCCGAMRCVSCHCSSLPPCSEDHCCFLCVVQL